MRFPMSYLACAVLLFLSFDCSLSSANNAESGVQDPNASRIPHIVYPSSEASLNNVKIQVSVTGLDLWRGGALLLVLDHGVQGLDVPDSGLVDLGIVAAGRSVLTIILYLVPAGLIVNAEAFFRHCVSLLPNASAHAVRNSSLSVLHNVCFSILSKRNDLSCHSAHRKLFQPQKQDVVAFQEVVDFAARIASGHRQGLQRLVAGEGRGIVIPGGGIKQLANVWVLLRTLRWLGCTLPVEIMYVGPSEMSAQFIDAAQQLGDTTLTDILWFPESAGLPLRGWPLKIRALIHSKFAEVIMLDADNVPLVDPSFLFSSSEYKTTGALFWHDFTSDPHWISPEFWSIHVQALPWSRVPVMPHYHRDNYDDYFDNYDYCDCYHQHRPHHHHHHHHHHLHHHLQHHHLQHHHLQHHHNFLMIILSPFTFFSHPLHSHVTRRVFRIIQANTSSRAGKWSSIALVHGMHFLWQRKLTGAICPTTDSCALRPH